MPRSRSKASNRSRSGSKASNRPNSRRSKSGSKTSNRSRSGSRRSRSGWRRSRSGSRRLLRSESAESGARLRSRSVSHKSRSGSPKSNARSDSKHSPSGSRRLRSGCKRSCCEDEGGDGHKAKNRTTLSDVEGEENEGPSADKTVEKEYLERQPQEEVVPDVSDNSDDAIDPNRRLAELKEEEAIKLCPKTPTYYGSRAAWCIMLNNFRGALADARKAVQLDQSFAKGYHQIIKCSIALGNIMTAEQAIKKINELDPSNANINNEIKSLEIMKRYENKAIKAYNKKNYTRVVYCMDKCLDEAVACSRYKINKAECLAFLGSCQEAQEIANSILHIDRGNADAMYVQGLCLFYESYIKSAMNHFEQVLHLAPDHKKSIDAYERAKVLKQKIEEGNDACKGCKFQEAINSYTEALTIDPLNKNTNSKLYFNRATIFAGLTKLKEAVADYTAALNLDDTYLKALLGRAECYMDLTEYEDAVHDYEKAYEMDKSRENKKLLQDAKLALKKSKCKDYYKIMGVDRTATDDEIKKAYKKRALVHHPDKHANATEAEKKEQETIFKEVVEAYRVLSNPAKKAWYDSEQDMEDFEEGMHEEQEEGEEGKEEKERDGEEEAGEEEEEGEEEEGEEEEENLEEEGEEDEDKDEDEKLEEEEENELLPMGLAELAEHIGNISFENKQYRYALPLYTKAIKLCPKTATYYGSRAACYIMLNNFHDALADARKAVQLDQSFTKGYHQILKCSIALGNIMTAEQAIEKINELDPSNANINNEIKSLEILKRYENKAIKAYNKKNYTRVVYCMDKCLDEAVTCSRYKINKAECLAFLGSCQEAQEIANSILHIDRGNADAMYVQGLCLFYESYIKSAMNHFEQVLHLAPDHKKSMDAYERAKVLNQKIEEGNDACKGCKFQEAINSYTEALAIDPLNKNTNAKLYFNRATIFAGIAKLKEAVADYTAALNLDHTYLKALLGRAECYMDLTEYEDAVCDYEKACEIDNSRENKKLWEDAKLAFNTSKCKDYYKIMGVDRTATDDEINKAYRIQEKKFKEVGEAYSVLSNPTKKARYDSEQGI